MTTKYVIVTSYNPENRHIFMKQKIHNRHIMKKLGAAIKEVEINSFAGISQPRLLTLFACDCGQKEVFFRQPDHPDFMANEYFKDAII